jgi:hypothetical protein
MNPAQQLEMLSESIKNEIDELQSLLENSSDYLLKSKASAFRKNLSNIISNLDNTNDSIYGVFEDLNYEDTEELKNNYGVMSEILSDKLSYDEKLYIKLKHHIELD